MLIGYARVSTEIQNLDLQVQALTEVGCKKIFEDHGYSGSKSNRPKLKEAISSLSRGDTFVVWKLDRLGRSLGHLVEMITDFSDKGIQFKSLTENIDTTSAGGTLIFHIMAAMAQFERDLTIERTNAGLNAARKRGVLLGRRKKLNSDRSNHMIELIQAGDKTIREIAQIMQVTPRTIYNEIRRKKSSKQSSLT